MLISAYVIYYIETMRHYIVEFPWNFNPYIEKLRYEKYNLKQTKGFFIPEDGTAFFYRYWRNENQIPESIIICIHGMHSHGESWILMADQLLHDDVFLGVYAVDLTHHGISSGPRGDIEDYRKVVNHLVDFFNFVKEEHPNVPIHIMAESMGGAFTVHLGDKLRDNIASLILLAPAVQPKSILKILMAVELWGVFSLTLSNRDIIPVNISKLVTNDEDYYNYQKNDFRRLKKRTPRYMYQILKMINQLKKIDYTNYPPILVFVGTQDIVIARGGQGCIDFFKKVESVRKESHLIPESTHTLLFDKSAEEFGLFERIKAWLGAYPDINDFKYFNAHRFRWFKT